MPVRRYVYARLSRWDFGVLRILGAGLGNLLFPWARSMVLARNAGLIPIFPAWPQLKLGPIFRRERDPRTYQDLFRPTSEYICGIAKLRTLIRRRYPESMFPEVLPPESLIECSGMEGFFAPIFCDHEYVLRKLVDICRDEHLAAWKQGVRNTIGIHVRLGDFNPAPPQSNADQPVTNVRLPIEWYVHAMQQIRRHCGPIQAEVFSDGSDTELAQLLRVRGVMRVNYGSSISELLALSRCRILVASGSTFSMWASYLGRMPAVWHPTRLVQRLYGEDSPREIPLALGDEMPASFATCAQRGNR